MVLRTNEECIKCDFEQLIHQKAFYLDDKVHLAHEADSGPGSSLVCSASCRAG